MLTVLGFSNKSLLKSAVSLLIIKIRRIATKVQTRDREAPSHSQATGGNKTKVRSIPKGTLLLGACLDLGLRLDQSFDHLEDPSEPRRETDLTDIE